MDLKESFAGLKEMALGYAGIAKKKAENVAAIAKANVAIHAEEDKIKKAEAELGRMYYNDFIAGSAADTEAYLPVCERITASKEAIAELREELAKMKAEDKKEADIEPDAVTDADFEVETKEVPVVEEAAEVVEEAAEAVTEAVEEAAEEVAEAVEETVEKVTEE